MAAQIDIPPEESTEEDFERYIIKKYYPGAAVGF
jgi:hypothetical protein